MDQAETADNYLNHIVFPITIWLRLIPAVANVHTK